MTATRLAREKRWMAVKDPGLSQKGIEGRQAGEENGEGDETHGPGRAIAR